MNSELPEATDEMGLLLEQWQQTHGTDFTGHCGEVGLEERLENNLPTSCFFDDYGFDEFH